jgi:hypothetical protein
MEFPLNFQQNQHGKQQQEDMKEITKKKRNYNIYNKKIKKLKKNQYIKKKKMEKRTAKA